MPDDHHPLADDEATRLRVIDGGRAATDPDPDDDMELLLRLLEESERYVPSSSPWLEEQRADLRGRISQLRPPRRQPLDLLREVADREMARLEGEVESSTPEAVGHLARLVESMNAFLLWARRNLE